MIRWRRGIGVAVLCGLLALTTLAGGVVADPAIAAAPDVRLVSQSVGVGPDEDLHVELEVDAATADAMDFVVSSRPLPTDPDDLRAGLLDVLAPIDDDIVVPRKDVVHSEGTVRLTIPTESRGDDPARLLLRSAGPYALTVSVDDGAMRLTTLVVRGDELAVPPLRVALGVVVESALTLQPDGTSSIEPGVREAVVRLVDVLSGAAAPVTVMVEPQLLAGLTRSGVPGDLDLVARLGVVLAGHTVLAAPSVHLDPSAAAVTAGLGPLFTSRLRDGEETLSALLGQFPDRRVWMATDPLSPDGASLVRDLGANVIVRLAGTGALETAALDTSPVGRPAGSIPILTPDVSGVALATGSDDPVLAAYVLAGTLVAAHRETPEAGVVVMADLDHVDPATLDAFVAVLATAKVLIPSRIDETTQPSGSGTASDAGDSFVIADMAEAVAAHGELVQLVSTTSAMLPDTDTRDDLWPELADAILDSRLSPTARADYVSGLDATLRGLQQRVVLLSPSAVNLGDRSSTVPITIRNDNAFPVVVEVRLVSAKLRFPPTSEAATVPASGTTQLRIPVDARTNGRFPVTAELLAPGTENRVGTAVTFSVRVGRLTGLGIVITFAAGLILLTWWVQHLRRRHRWRGGAASLERHPVASQTAASQTPASRSSA